MRWEPSRKQCKDHLHVLITREIRFSLFWSHDCFSNDHCRRLLLILTFEVLFLYLTGFLIEIKISDLVKKAATRHIAYTTLHHNTKPTSTSDIHNILYCSLEACNVWKITWVLYEPCSDPLSGVLLSWFQTEAVFTGSGLSTWRTGFTPHTCISRAAWVWRRSRPWRSAEHRCSWDSWWAAPGWYVTDHTFIHGPSHTSFITTIL